MKFEWDKKKNEKNLIKHKISFNEAQKLWDDPNYIEIPAKSDEEPRFMVIGRIDEKTWSGFITYRNNIIRIISVRRSRKEEIEVYEIARA